MGPIAKAGIQSAQSGISGLIGNLFQRRNLKRQTEANKELQQYAYDLNMQQWHAQNLYNSPKAQMQRYKEAGLNPNLMYGQGSSGNASASPQMQAPTAGRHQTKMPKMDMLAMYNNQRQVDASVSNLNARTSLTDLQSSTALIDQAIKRINGEQKQWNLSMDKTFGTRERSNKLHITQMQSEGARSTYKNIPIQQELLLKRYGGPSQAQAYQMQAKKMALIDGQIDLALIDLATKKRAYKWQNVNNIAGITGKAVGLAIGGKFTKGAAKRLKTPAKPKFSKYSYNDYKSNRDIGPNTSF